MSRVTGYATDGPWVASLQDLWAKMTTCDRIRTSMLVASWNADLLRNGTNSLIQQIILGQHNKRLPCIRVPVTCKVSHVTVSCHAANTAPSPSMNDGHSTCYSFQPRFCDRAADGLVSPVEVPDTHLCGAVPGHQSLQGL